jgi:anti-anti-sigma factor
VKPELQLDERVPACAVVRLHGHMVAGSVDNLAERIEARRTPEWRSLVVDLAGVDALSSSGIRVLLKLEQWTRRCGLWFATPHPKRRASASSRA